MISIPCFFVTNLLNGTVAGNGSVVHGGTIVRVSLQGTQPPLLNALTAIGDGFSEHTDPAALVVGPTGVGLSPATNGETTSLCSKQIL